MMTEEEFRADLLAGAASRAESVSSGFREAFTDEVLDRLREAGELPDTERCTEALTGRNGRKLEVDAFVFDDADDSLHLFVAILDGGGSMPPVLTLTEAREQGFNRLLGVFEQAATDGLWRISKKAILWSLARRIQGEGRRTAVRLHVVSDRCISERIREIPADVTQSGEPITSQIWDVTRLQAHSGWSERPGRSGGRF